MVQSDVSAGSISSTDATVLSTALDDIDSALQGGSDAGSTGLSTSSSSPTDMKGKIDSLIEGEVSKGTLASDQADELKQVFAQAGPPGPPPPPPADASSSTDSDSSSTSTDSSSGSSSSSDVQQILAELLQLLQNSQSTTTGYSASGSTTSSVSSSLVLNKVA